MHPIETQNLPMSRSEIDTVRELLRSKPRPTGFAERRERLDAIGSISPVAGDIRLEPIRVNGVPAEWSPIMPVNFRTSFWCSRLGIDGMT